MGKIALALFVGWYLGKSGFLTTNASEQTLETTVNADLNKVGIGRLFGRLDDEYRTRQQ